MQTFFIFEWFRQFDFFDSLDFIELDTYKNFYNNVLTFCSILIFEYTMFRHSTIDIDFNRICISKGKEDAKVFSFCGFIKHF